MRYFSTSGCDVFNFRFLKNSSLPVWGRNRKSESWRCRSWGWTVYIPKVSSESILQSLRRRGINLKINGILIFMTTKLATTMRQTFLITGKNLQNLLMAIMSMEFQINIIIMATIIITITFNLRRYLPTLLITHYSIPKLNSVLVTIIWPLILTQKMPVRAMEIVVDH